MTSLTFTFGTREPQRRTFHGRRDGLRMFGNHYLGSLSRYAHLGDSAARYVKNLDSYTYLHFTVFANRNTRVLEDAWQAADVDEQRVISGETEWQIVSLNRWSAMPLPRYVVQMETVT